MSIIQSELSSVATSKGTSEITCMVNTSIEHLQDLAIRIRDVKVEESDSYKTPTSLLVDSIIEALKELDAERIRLHEELETETITASNLRFKLVSFPKEIESEIRGAVRSARESNESEIQSLQEQIDSLIKEIENLEHRYEVITVDNHRLEPERDKLRIEHEKTVALLNQTLADRASLQIKLNETRDKLRESYKSISALEQANRDLDAEMVEEREETELEKRKLEKAVADTRVKVDEQRRANIMKQREIEKVQDEVTNMEMILDEKKKKIRQYEGSRGRLEAQQVHLSRQLQKEIRENAALTQEGMKAVKEGSEIAQKLTSIQKELRSRLYQINEETKRADDDHDTLNREKMKFLNKLGDANASGTKEKDEAEEMEKGLRRAKDNLLFENEECSRLKRENAMLEATIENLQQDHIAVAELLMKQIQDSTANLESERKERQVLQSRRDSVTKETNEFKNDYGKYMAVVTKRTNDGKAEHQRLTEYGARLQKNLKQDEIDIAEKQQRLKKAKADYIALQKDLRKKIKELQESISKLENELETKKNMLKEKTTVSVRQLIKPLFEDLEKLFTRKTREFEEMKKYIVDLKNKKSGTETAVERTQAEIQKMEHPQNELREALSEARVNYLQQLKKQTDEEKSKESEILLAGQRLNLVLKENQRLSDAISQLESEIQFIQNRIKALENDRGLVEREITDYKDWLEAKWLEDMKLDQEYYERDIPFLDDLQQIQEVSKDREGRVEEIRSQIVQQLDLLANFIDGVAGLRPEEDS